MKWFMLFVTVFATAGCFSRMQMGSGSFTFEQIGMMPVSLQEAAFAECMHNYADARRCYGTGYGGYGGSYYGGYGQTYMPRVDPNYYGYSPSYGTTPYGQSGVETEAIVHQIQEMTEVILEISEEVEAMERSEP